MIDAIRAQLQLIIKGCACCREDCQMCRLNRLEAMQALAMLEGFDLMLVCRKCGGIAEPGEHICGEDS